MKQLNDDYIEKLAEGSVYCTMDEVQEMAVELKERRTLGDAATLEKIVSLLESMMLAGGNTDEEKLCWLRAQLNVIINEAVSP